MHLKQQIAFQRHYEPKSNTKPTKSPSNISLTPSLMIVVSTLTDTSSLIIYSKRRQLASILYVSLSTIVDDGGLTFTSNSIESSDIYTP